jgi:hypothetical protein
VPGGSVSTPPLIGVPAAVSIAKSADGVQRTPWSVPRPEIVT